MCSCVVAYWRDARVCVPYNTVSYTHALSWHQLGGATTHAINIAKLSEESIPL